MPAANQDLYVEQYTTFSKRLDFAENDEPTDLTDHTFKGQIKFETLGPLVGELIFEKSNQTTDRGGLYIKMDQSVWAKIKLPPCPAGEIKTFTYRYDVTQTYPDGSTERVLQGAMTISPGITRP